MGSELARPPACPPPAARTALCDCHTGTLCDCHLCLCERQKQHHSDQQSHNNQKFTKWIAVAPFGAFVVAAGSYGPPGAIGTPPGPQNGPKKLFSPTGTLCGCQTGTLCGCQTRKLCGCQTRTLCDCYTGTLAASHICVSATKKYHVSWQKMIQKSKMSRNGSPWLRLGH